MSSLHFDHVSKHYGKTPAVEDFNLDVDDGEMICLVGPSGCGKSTLLRMIAGLEEITGGEIRIGDRVVNDLAPQQRDVAMVFQNYALYPHMTVRKNLLFPLRMMRMPKAEAHRHVKRVAEMLGLTDLLERRPKQLSGGQRQRVAMGRAMVREPEVFLLDEPLSNLDAKLRVQMRTEIASIQRELRTTAVYVTHDQVEAMTMGDRLAVLNHGRLQQAGRPQELYDRPANAFVATFIGSPSMNLFLSRFEPLADGGTGFRYAGATVPVADDRLRDRGVARGHIGTEVILGLRPEAFVHPRDVPESQRVRVEVQTVEPLGHELLAYFHVEGTPPAAENVGDFAAAAARGIDADADPDEAEKLQSSNRLRVVARLKPDAPVSPGQICEIGIDSSQLFAFDAHGNAMAK